jgi:hypothetical protein
MASALLYLLLGLWLGPSRALHLVLVITLVLAWYQVSRAIPLVAIGFMGFVRGALGR